MDIEIKNATCTLAEIGDAEVCIAKDNGKVYYRTTDVREDEVRCVSLNTGDTVYLPESFEVTPMHSKVLLFNTSWVQK